MKEYQRNPQKKIEMVALNTNSISLFKIPHRWLQERLYTQASVIVNFDHCRWVLYCITNRSNVEEIGCALNEIKHVLCA